MASPVFLWLISGLWFWWSRGGGTGSPVRFAHPLVLSLLGLVLLLGPPVRAQTAPEGPGARERASDVQGGPASAPGVRSGAGTAPYGSGRALGLDGADDYVRVPDDPAVNTDGPYAARTIDLWFWASDVGRLTQQVLYEEGGEAEGLNIYLKGGTLYLGIWRDHAFSQWVTTELVSGKRWHHVALVFDGSDGVIRGYVDGRTVGTGAASSSLSTHADDTAIGAVLSETVFEEGTVKQQGNYFEGQVDQVRLWDAALTRSQLRARARRTIVPGDPAADSLIAAYRFDAASDTAALDSWTGDGTAQDGSLSGDPNRRAFSGAQLGQVSAVRMSGDTTIGPAGGTISVQNVSTSGSDAIQVYQYGSTDGSARYVPDAGEDFSGTSDDVVKRLHVVWGVDTLGTSATGDFGIDYSGMNGFNDHDQVRLLRRSGPGQPWTEVTSQFTWDKSNRTFQISHVPTPGQYAIGEELPPPTARADRDTTDQNTSLSVPAPGVLGNDTDPDDDPLTVTQRSGVAAGNVTLQSDGAFEFDPEGDFDALAADEHQTVEFAYEASDSVGTDDAATVRITVEGRNDAPMASGDRVTTAEETPVRLAGPGVLENDDDIDGDSLGTHLHRGPAEGLLTLAEDGSFEYDPDGTFRALGPGQEDSTTFSYIVQDVHGAADTAAVTVTVSGTNTKPVATADRDTTDERVATATPVLVNDSDPEGRLDTSSVSIVAFPSHGSIGGSTSETVVYTPNKGFAGTDTYRYSVADRDGRIDTATVSVFVTNVPPPAVDQLQATGSSQAITMDWSASTDQDFAAYQVYHSTGVHPGRSQPTDTIPDRSVTSHTVRGLTSRDVYTVGVTVRDTAGNESPVASARAVPRPDVLSWDGSVSFGPVDETSGYRMIGLPGTPGDVPVDSTMSGSAGSTWTAYAASGIMRSDELVAYSDAPDSLTFARGHGLWVLSKTSWTPSGTTSPAPLSSDVASEVPVPDGWTIITNPFPEAVSWSKVRAATPGLDSTRALWGYDGRYQKQNALRPYEGYYLFNDPATPIDTLRIPYPTGAVGTSGIGTRRKEWQQNALTIVATAGGTSARAELRVDETAHEDAAGHFAPPPVGSAVWLAARNEQASTAYPWVKQDIRSSEPDGTATFTLRVSGPPAQTVHLSGEQLDELRGQAVYVADHNTERVFDLREERAALHIPGSEETRRHRTVEVWVGPPEALEERRAAYAPDHLALKPPEPNPTPGSARLQYTVPERTGPVQAKVVIYDVLGRQIQRLVDGKKEPGHYAVHWQGRDGRGKRLASGVYLCRFVADGKVVQTRKISLVR